MNCWIVLLTLGQVEAEPLDAFRANRASIRADIEFTYTIGHVDQSLIRDGLWSAGRPEPKEFPAQTALGRWEFDGTAEHLVQRPRADLARPEMAPSRLVSYQPPFEMVYDGQVAAYHLLAGADDPALNVFATNIPAYIRRGPFLWLWPPRPFPDWLGDAAPGLKPTHGTARRGGHATVSAIYHRDAPTGWTRIEVYYDPAIGYLPRYVRFVSHATQGRSKGKAMCKEMYLMEARPCSAGGFVPTEFYEVSFGTRRFPADFLDVDYDTVTQFNEGTASLGHFVVSKFEERTRPVRLDHLEGVKAVVGVGGVVSLARTPKTLGLGEAKAILGRRFDHPIKMHLPTLDSAELHKYDGPPRVGRVAYYLAALAASALAALVIFRRRWGLVAPLLGLALLPGCGRVGPVAPVLRLSGEFAEGRLIYDPKNPWLPVTLVLKNAGNIPVRVNSLAAGCSCRKVERSLFPASLEPGGSLRVPVELHDRRQFEPQTVPFVADTDHGSQNVPATLLALPAHPLSPETVALPALDEADGGSFELVHRAISRAGAPRPATRLDVPTELEAKRLGARSGVVAGAPDFECEDTTYRVEIKDRAFGLHKAPIALRDGESAPLVEAPVVWKRLEFLSAMPDRAILGTRPVRVFLRCPDPDVELRRVVSAPEGIRAVISSTRELTVRLADDAPGVISGTVEVETSAGGRPPLRVAVVRYAPTAAKDPVATLR